MIVKILKKLYNLVPHITFLVWMAVGFEIGTTLRKILPEDIYGVTVYVLSALHICFLEFFIKKRRIKHESTDLF